MKADAPRCSFLSSTHQKWCRARCRGGDRSLSIIAASCRMPFAKS